MRKGTSQGKLAFVIIVAALIVDQVVKYLVKTNMVLGQQIYVTEWFRIAFVENNGMAFGMEIFNKLFLTLFRLVAITAFVWYLLKIKNKGYPTGYVAVIAFIIAGAAGNVIDCVLYGQLFTESAYGAVEPAALTSFGSGYAPLFYGKVVDMFYFPLWTWPEWLPLIGGNIFFGPVFNVADSCISCGVVALVAFYSKFINNSLSEKSSGNEKGA